MDAFIKLFGNINLGTVLLVYVALTFVLGQIKDIKKKIIVPYEEQKAKDELLENISGDLKKIQEEQNVMKQEIAALLENQKEINKKQDDFEEQSKKHNLNKLRDRLLQSYRLYTNKELNPLGAWSEMEKDTFDHLFSDYDALGGNGFLHSTVQPEMEKLQVIPMSDLEKITELMSSRKG